MVYLRARVPCQRPATRCEPGRLFEISNIDLKFVGKSRPVGIRAHYAQHAFGAHGFSHRLGSAGIHDGGTSLNVHFYGVVAYGPQTFSWVAVSLIDATFEIRGAAIREHEAD